MIRDFKIRVKELRSTSAVCSYKFEVFIANDFEENGKFYCRSFDEQDYVEETLRKWFGEVERSWGVTGSWVYLCGLK